MQCLDFSHGRITMVLPNFLFISLFTYKHSYTTHEIRDALYKRKKDNLLDNYIRPIGYLFNAMIKVHFISVDYSSLSNIAFNTSSFVYAFTQKRGNP